MCSDKKIYDFLCLKVFKVIFFTNATSVNADFQMFEKIN